MAAIDQYRSNRSLAYTNGISLRSPSMLGGLSPNSAKHGIHTIPKGDCAACDQPIIGQIVMAMGRMWHPEHYVCAQCGVQLGQQNFIERAGKAYCENDYHEIFSSRCGYCNSPIKDRCVNALGKTFHADHFVCVECGRGFGSEGFHERDGQPYCKADYFRLFAPKCQGCKQPVTSRFLTALGHPWHPDCFACADCGKGFNGKAFLQIDDVPLCEEHYHARRGSVCGACRGPIVGRCVVALGQRFHPEHFTCNTCNRVLTAKNFKEAAGHAQCQKCYEKVNPPLVINPW